MKAVGHVQRCMFPIPKHTQVFAELGRRLEALRYDTCVRLVRGPSYFMVPFPAEDPAMMRHYLQLMQLEPARRTAMRLLLFDEAVSLADARAAFSPSLLDGLLEVGFLVSPDSSDTVRTDSYRCIPFCGSRFIVNYQTIDPDSFKVYLGYDSYYVANSLPPSLTGKTLDLCAGSGILGILAARRGGRAVGVEIDPAAAQVARANVALNGLSPEAIDIRCADLWSAVEGERFDLVLANPPFVPVPDGLEFPAYSGSGPDGADVLRQIVEALPDHLTPNGRAIIVFQIPGDFRGPVVSGYLESQARHGPPGLTWEVAMVNSYPITRKKLRSMAALPVLYAGRQHDQAEIERVTDSLAAFYKQHNYTHNYCCLLFVYPRCEADGAGDRFKMSPLFFMLTPDRPLKVHPDIEYRETDAEHLELVLPDGNVFAINDRVRFLLEACDGTHTIHEALDSYWRHFGDRIQRPRNEMEEDLYNLLLTFWGAGVFLYSSPLGS